METTFPVLCAWCKSNGVLRVVGRSTVEDSDGMCLEHKRSLTMSVLRKEISVVDREALLEGAGQACTTATLESAESDKD